MLIIPTSLDTAIVLQFQQPLLWSVLMYCSLTVAAYCLWEMLLSSLDGHKPPSSRWIWLAIALAFLGAGALTSSLLPAEVSFNADSANWVSTSWGTVLGDLFLVAFAATMMVVLGLRIADTVSRGRSGSPLYAASWVIGLCLMVFYGVLLALNAERPYGSATETAVLTLTAALVVAGVGSLLAMLAVRWMRRSQSRRAVAESV